jgi:8-oxo-dGTP pyrophosphatase MutT (NUDIX family)
VLISIERTAQILRGQSQADTEGECAAVALVLQERKNGPELLVIQRAHNDRDPWSGHLAFPGGKRDPADTTLVDTAMRETLEEVGLDLSQHGRLLGPLAPLGARSTRPLQLTVAPFVFELLTETELRLDPREVQATFWLPLHPVQRGQANTSITIKRQALKMKLPGYQVEGGVLWGMSYQMLRSLFALHGD